ALALAPLLDRYRSIERLQHLDSAYRDLVLARIAAIELATGRAAEALSVVEELRRRNPRLIGGLGDLGAIADAYHAERQFRLGLTWQSRLFDELYQRDRNVRDTLWSIGERLESQTVGLYLVRTYPHSNRTIGDAFELARRYAAIEAPPSTGRKGALHAEAVESLAEFIAWFPTTPLAPQAEHLVIQSLTTMGDLDAVAVESERFRTRYPNHPLVDEALFAGLEAQFERRDYDAVVKSARALIDGRFPTEGKREPQPSPFATGARWILAKTLHIQGEIAAAVSEYRALESLVPEAKDALAWLTARELEVPEIVQSGTSEKSTLEIEWKNLDRLSIQIYRVDLPLLFASRKDLRGISSVDLTGIEPERELVIALEGEPYVAQKTKIDLPLEKAGVWLINARSENRVGSSVVLRSDLSVDVRRKDERIQVFVSPPGSAKVKVSDGSRVVASGNADARGFFEAVVGGRKASVLVERDGHFALWNE
ncbi:MAG TPA: hypothetical protein VK116_04465, partial [Planctomycetota bacterium]|nr:hypothetical protein [Planctomycetota bacterium]